MFVITADQRNSRNSPDLVGQGMSLVLGQAGTEFPADGSLDGQQPPPRFILLGPERTVGDEFQFATDAARKALEALLALTRDGNWSVGLGIGAVDPPWPASVREGRGAAFISARVAVERAKRRATLAAVHCEDDQVAAADLEALLDLLLLLRNRRTTQGWEISDLLASGMSQVAAAERLGITGQSASQRARIAGISHERSAIAAIERLLEKLDSIQPT